MGNKQSLRMIQPHHLKGIVLLLSCLLLLGACADASLSNGNQARHRARKYVATVSDTLVQQVEMESATFQQWIGLMEQYKGDVSQYRQEYNRDQRALIMANSANAFQGALMTLSEHVNSIKLEALKVEASTLGRQLSQEAAAWGQQHTYHDSYNGETYHMGYEYGNDGVGGWLQDELTGAKTLADYRQAVEDGNAFLTSFQAYQTNASDKTPWNQAHNTDLQLIQHYNYMQQKVVVISLGEQAMRIYDHGRLVRAYQVTTGRPEKPSLPGNWPILEKLSPTIFKSDEPKGSAYWYPDTPITYAMLYHSGGYFIHDSWWRDDYGPNTQFPHVDSSGDSFSFDGSHGCVNIATANAAWVYNFVNVNTHVLVY